MLTYFVIAPILIAVLLYLVPFVRARQLIVALTQGALFAAAIYLFVRVGEGEIVTNVGDYRGVLGITLRADMLTAVFVLLTTLIFLIVAIYSFDEKKSKLFWFLLFIWEGAFIGLFLTRDLFNIFVLTEVATVAAAVLLMYNRGRRSMYNGLVYLLVNVLVMQFYLLGVGYLYMQTGVLDMDYIAAYVATLDRSQLVLPYALILTAIAAKCSILPLFTFLPKIHSIPRAPASVAALLSALQVKSGLYLFLRFQHMFGGIDSRELFLVLGVITAIFGVLMALMQTDIKRLLAYSTIAQVGLILIGLQIESAYAYAGSLYHIFTHAIAKAALFLTAGMLIRIYGTRDVTAMRGVMRQTPIVGIATILAILSIIGAPLFSGSISKYFIMADASFPLYLLMIFINLGTVTIFIKYAAILIGRPPGDLEPIRMEPFQLTTVILLGVLCLAGGVFGQHVIDLLFGFPVTVSTAGYLEKIAILVASVGVGLLIYKHGIQDRAPIPILIRFDLGFRGICVSIGGFFALLLIVIGVLG